MSDLVPAANMAAVEALEPEAQALAVTQMLSEARSWLAHAVEASEPQSIANFKAQMATVAEATKQLGLSKEIQLDAQEMVRRAERGVGLAIRKGQADGTVATESQMRQRAGQIARGSYQLPEKELLTPSAVAGDERALSSNGAGIYRMTDDVSDEEFDAAIEDAKSEGNLSRANVVRKIRNEASKLTGEKRLDKIAELARRGHRSSQIARELGHSEEYIRLLARENDITIPADLATGRSRRIDHDRIADQTVATLEGLALGLQLLDLDQVDPSRVGAWATSLNESLRVLNRFRNQIKEMAHA